MNMAIAIDTELCIGCAACASVAPQIFEVVGRRSRVLRGARDADERAVTEAAMAACPVGAITCSALQEAGHER